MVVGERAGTRPALPEYLVGAPKADKSRLLEAAETRHQRRKEREAPAVTYRRVQRGDDDV
ncbi:hypothetical protein D3C80_1168830 [compost metagenome]